LASIRTPRVLPPGMAHARRSALLMLVGLVASSTPLPYTAVAVLPLVWSGVESVRAIRAMSGGRAPTRGIVWSAVGLVMVCALTVMVVLPYAVYGPAKRLQDCTGGANTAVAMAECKSHFYGGLESFLGGLVSVEQRADG
jgi:phosphoribosylcarboxyaminoimidazole (NCAIR) mutase